MSALTEGDNQPVLAKKDMPIVPPNKVSSPVNLLHDALIPGRAKRLKSKRAGARWGQQWIYLEASEAQTSEPLIT